MKRRPASAGSVNAPLFDVDLEYGRRHDVVRYLLGFGVDSAEAEDITQEVFLTALEPSSGAARPQNPFAWLITCAKRLAIRRGQRGRREVSASGARWVWDEAADPTPGVEAFLDGVRLRRRVRRALASLTAEERRCLTMRSHGRTFREIGEALGMKLHQAAYLTDVAIEKVQREIGVAG